jgi:hypothetical protein
MNAPRQLKRRRGIGKIRCIRPDKSETPGFAQETRAQYSFFSSLLD